MRRDLVDILACPLDKSELRLDVAEEREAEILRGSLTCTQCGEVYPIDGGIPNLLPPDLRESMARAESGPSGH